LLVEAGFPQGFKTQLHATGGYGPDRLDAVQLVQCYLKDVGIEAELKLQEFGAYFATTLQGKFAGMAMGPFLPGWEPDSVLSGPYTPDSLRNSSHVNDPKLTAMLKEQRRTKDLRRYRQPGVTEDILFCQRTGSVGPPSPAPGSAVGHCTSAWRPT
jgi:ABC-type transport system substrate-binding protein